MSEIDKFTQMLEDLGVDTSEEARAYMPSAGIAFPAGTFIAPWLARMGYGFFIDTDPSEVEDEDFPKPDMTRARGDWYDYYYFGQGGYDRATQAYKETFGSEYSVQQLWVFHTETARIANRDPVKLAEGFGDEIVIQCPVRALMMGGAFEQKNRHQFNLIAQPMAVATLADYAGFENAGFSIDELVGYEERKQEAGFDAEKFFLDMCGDSRGDYKESELYKRRLALWKSLGEEDGTKTASIGTTTPKGKESKDATASEKLSTCITFSQNDWKTPIWCRVGLIPNPHPEEVQDNGRQRTFGVLMEVYKSEEEARIAGAAEVEEREGHPPVPENWASAGPDEWIKYLKDNLEGSVPNPGQAASVAAEAYCTAEEVIAWAEYMRDQGEL